MTNLQTLKNQLSGAMNVYICYKEEQNAKGMETYKNLIQELEAEIKALETVEVAKEATQPTTEEFTYYSVWGEVDYADKSIKVLGTTVNFEVTEYTYETVVKLAPKYINQIVNIDWEMNKSHDFIIKLTNKLVKMYKEVLAA